MAPLPMGSIVYLTSAIIKARIKAEETMPDTPSLYSADLDLMNDPGHLNTELLVGQKGTDGQAQFAYRRMDDGTPYQSFRELPQNLTDSADDIGKYWVIPVYDAEGTIVEQWAWVWRGHALGYRKTYMGSEGPPGPVPKIKPSTELIDLRVHDDAKSFVETTGTITSPSWRFNVAVPIGPPGPPSPVNDFPDFQPDAHIAAGAVMMHSGTVGTTQGARGKPIFRPANIQALIPRVYSVPEASFEDHQGTWANIRNSGQVNVGQFSIPAQPFDWTPVVWGHTTTGRFRNPWKIGLEVRLNKQRDGELLARGFGNVRGEVHVYPHYSSSGDRNAHVSPKNGYVKVPAGQKATVYMNLTNDGVFGMYNFTAANAQLIIMVTPLDAYRSYTPLP